MLILGLEDATESTNAKHFSISVNKVVLLELVDALLLVTLASLD